MQTDLWAGFYRHVLLPVLPPLAFDGRRPTLERLAALHRTEWHSHDELAELQTRDLRRLLQHAHAHVPLYRRRITEAGLDPLRIRDVGDLERLPLLRRDDVETSHGELQAEPAGQPAEAIVRKSTTGTTTGKPMSLAYNYDSEIWRQALRLRGYGWAGYVPGRRTVHYWGPVLRTPTPFWAAMIFLDRGVRRETYLDCARQSEADLRAAAETLRRLRPGYLISFPQAAATFARFVIDQKLRDWAPMQVICGGERLFPEDRPVLEEAFGQAGSVFETYGCREFMLIASECPAHAGLHVSMENLVVEIVDERGRGVAPGETGQVAVTDLHNHAMPLIRYLTGDLAVALPPTERCPCGRGLARLHSIEGRENDFLRAANGSRIPGMLFITIFARLSNKVRQFQVRQSTDDRVRIQLVPGPEFDKVFLDDLRATLRPYFGDLPLSLDVVSAIPAPLSGKRKFIVRECR